MKTHKEPEVAIPIIQAHVARAMDIDAIELATGGKTARMVWYHRLVCTLARELTRASYPEIAAATVRPTHTTCMASEQRFREELDRDPNQVVAGQRLRNMYLRLKSELEAKFAEAA